MNDNDITEQYEEWLRIALRNLTLSVKNDMFVIRDKQLYGEGKTVAEALENLLNEEMLEWR